MKVLPSQPQKDATSAVHGRAGTQRQIVAQPCGPSQIIEGGQSLDAVHERGSGTSTEASTETSTGGPASVHPPPVQSARSGPAQ